MKKPVLVVMAAGMGSRYGGLKQIDPIDGEGHLIIDFSIYDAVRAGFEKVIFIIKREDEKDFRAAIGDRLGKQVETVYVYQDLNDLPQGFTVPAGRVKPWGTAHAVLCCKEVLDGPFAVINADDFYGRGAFQMAYDFLGSARNGHYMMVGYQVENTLTENGHVARGVCSVDEEGYLSQIHERTRIERRQGGAAYTEDEGNTWVNLPYGTLVSMNMWGFAPDFITELDQRFSGFLAANLENNPLKCEYFLPFVVDELLREGKATVKVLRTPDRWYGVTYRQDKPVVMEAVEKLKSEGVYPRVLWN